MEKTAEQSKEPKTRPMTPKEVNTLLMDLMGIPKKAQNGYRAANKLA